MTRLKLPTVSIRADLLAKLRARARANGEHAATLLDGILRAWFDDHGARIP